MSKFIKKKAEEITAEDIDELNLLLANSYFNPSAVGLVRKLGDMLSDRGNDDYKTIKIIEQLGKHKVPFELIASNHDFGFLCRIKNKNSKYLYEPFTLEDSDQCKSMHTLGILVNKGLVSENEIDNIIKKHYIPHLKLISYSIDDQHHQPLVSIFSHAPIGLETVEALAKKYHITYKSHTVDALCTTIDKINKQFMQSDIIADFKKEVADIKAAGKYEDGVVPLHYPLFRTIWNRGRYDKTINVPSIHNGYLLRFVHGHEGSIAKDFHQHHEIKSYKKNMINLDITLGKKEITTGTFYSYVSHDKNSVESCENKSRMFSRKSKKEINKNINIRPLVVEIKMEQEKSANKRKVTTHDQTASDLPLKKRLRSMGD